MHVCIVCLPYHHSCMICKASGRMKGFFAGTDAARRTRKVQLYPILYVQLYVAAPLVKVGLDRRKNTHTNPAPYLGLTVSNFFYCYDLIFGNHSHWQIMTRLVRPCVSHPTPLLIQAHSFNPHRNFSYAQSSALRCANRAPPDCIATNCSLDISRTIESIDRSYHIVSILSVLVKAKSKKQSIPYIRITSKKHPSSYRACGAAVLLK